MIACIDDIVNVNATRFIQGLADEKAVNDCLQQQVRLHFVESHSIARLKP